MHTSSTSDHCAQEKEPMCKRLVELTLREYPQARENADSFIITFIEKSLKGDYKRLKEFNTPSLLRFMRKIQNEEKRYLPTAKAREYRRKQEIAMRNIMRAIKPVRMQAESV